MPNIVYHVYSARVCHAQSDYPLYTFFISIVGSVIAEIVKRGHRDILNCVSTAGNTIQYVPINFGLHLHIIKTKKFFIAS